MPWIYKNELDVLRQMFNEDEGCLMPTEVFKMFKFLQDHFTFKFSNAYFDIGLWRGIAKFKEK